MVTKYLHVDVDKTVIETVSRTYSTRQGNWANRPLTKSKFSSEIKTRDVITTDHIFAIVKFWVN
jgi:hypothetical protein